MSVFTGIAIYLTIWWTVLFSVLPIGVQSHAEAGIDKGDGGDPGAPVDPKLKQSVCHMLDLTNDRVAAVIEKDMAGR